MLSRAMIKILVSCIVLLNLVSCGGEDIENSDGVRSSSSSSSSTTSSSSSGLLLGGNECKDLIEIGKHQYDNVMKCANCHGADGKSANFKVINFAAETYRHSTMLASDPSLSLDDYIAEYMPPGSLCEGACADSVAVYVKSLGGIEWCPDNPAEKVEKRVAHQPAHRLNNVQYDNTVKDLLGVDIEPSQILPPDSAVGGFDNVAEGLNFSADSLDLYLAASDEIVDAAFVDLANLNPVINPSRCNSTQMACQLQIVSHLLERGYRRPPSSEESARFENLFRTVTSAETALDAFKQTTKAILLSPKFLLRTVRVTDVKETLISPFVLAERLSYFLWSTMPDEELYQKAKTGELLNEVELRNQVDRMMRHAKAKGFIEDFFGQWLSLRRLQNALPSPELFPSFNEAIREAMVLETELFMKEFMLNDIPLGRMVNPDFAFLNNALAAHYGLPSPNSEVMTKVLVGEGQRKGIFMLGGWITAESDPESTNPMGRGAWVLDHLMCAPLGGPPPDAPTVLPNNEAGTLSIRERLALHRIEPSCAGCHDLIDPAGLGFEYFNPVGAPALDAPDSSGGLPGGYKFNTPLELPNMMSNGEEVSDCLAQKLYAYVHARQLVDADQLYMQDISRAVSGDDSFIKLLNAIVRSPSFMHSPSVEALHQLPGRPVDLKPVDPKPVDPKQPGERQWQFCANEGDVCQFEGKAQVRFGKDDTWIIQEHNNQVECTRFVFGDPLPGVRKKCEVFTAAE